LALPYFTNFTGARTPPTNENGEFEIPDIIPGMQVVLRLNESFATGRNAQPLPLVKAGETRDMGALELKR
jgi:hypothetical protein